MSKIPSCEEDILAWLETQPALDALRQAYPGEWDVVQRELAAIYATGKPEDLRTYLHRPLPLLRRSGKGSKSGRDALIRRHVRRRMALLSVKHQCLAVAAGSGGGKMRFNLFNGFIAQKLLFARDLERKAVPLFWFRLLWPLVTQRRLLMPLVQPKGIYCFFSDALVKSLAALVGGRRCLEIAAGDGCLTRLLRAAGVAVTATDDHSWGHSVAYPEWVVRQEAGDALRAYVPQVVICSWPPANNTFERQVFANPSVELYIVISSRLEVASGDWSSYRAQTSFSMELDDGLSRLVLPPELGSAVYLFRRKPEV